MSKIFWRWFVRNSSQFKILFFPILYVCFFSMPLLGQSNEQHRILYIKAFNEINQMLEGKSTLQFKRAIFLMENAYLNNTLNYNQFNNEIVTIATKLRSLIKERNLEGYRTAANWAVFTYMVDSVASNDYHPYTYDFQYFISSNDPEVGFVSKLLKTRKGNCNSLPFLYKLLVEECGGAASLALAPFHCFIKHKDEKGNWVNLEMTSGSFARDAWIIQQTGVTVEQISSGIYMNALSQKQSLSFILKDLAANYQMQFGADEFDERIVNTGLHYYPNGIHLYLVKFEHYRIKLLTARKLQQPESEAAIKKKMAAIEQKLGALGYKEPSQKEYEEWVHENEKQKIVTK